MSSKCASFPYDPPGDPPAQNLPSYEIKLSYVLVTGSGYRGGLIGYDYVSPGDLSSTYWDTTTSGITNASQGAGFPANDPGIKAKTTTQLKSALPNGFSSAIWGESAPINGGLPYLLSLPPS